MNEQVQNYFQKQPTYHKEILEQLRELILSTFPGIEEGFLWGVPVYDSGRFYLASLKKQVNFGFSIIGLSPEEVKLFEGGGKTARHIKVFALLSEEEKGRLVELMKLVREKAGVPK